MQAQRPTEVAAQQRPPSGGNGDTIVENQVQRCKEIARAAAAVGMPPAALPGISGAMMATDAAAQELQALASRIGVLQQQIAAVRQH